MLTRFQKVYYGMARFGPSAMLDMLDIATSLFYFSIQRLPAIYTGISMGVSYIAIMVSELVFGNLSDRTRTKVGRRKPFVLVGAPGMALSFALVFTPHLFLVQGDVIALFLYALITQSLFKIFYGMTMTPFQSWMPELTEPEERPSVSSWQNIANFMGFVVGVFGTTLLAVESYRWCLPPTLRYMLIAFIWIQLAGFIAPLTGLRKEGKHIEQPDLLKDVRRALRNRDFLGWILAQGLLSIGFAMVIKSAFPFINDYLHFGTTEFAIFGAELLLIVFVFFMIWRWMIKNKGKGTTLRTAMIITALSLVLTLIVQNALQGFIMIALVGVGLAGYYLMPYIIYADFANKDEIITGESRAGFYTSFPSIPLNTCQAISAFLWGFVFSLPEVAPVPSTPSETVSLGYLYWGPIAAVFILLAVVILTQINIDPDFEKLKSVAQRGVQGAK
ncbi:MAG: MFS transporter [Candidatus Thorarchaeota archaeon]